MQRIGRCASTPLSELIASYKNQRMHISPWMYNTYDSHIYLTVKRSVIVHFHSLLVSTGLHDDYGPLSQKSRNLSGQEPIGRSMQFQYIRVIALS